MHDDCPWIFARVIQYIYYGNYTLYHSAWEDMTPSVADVVRGGCRDTWMQVLHQGDPIMKVRSEIQYNTANIAVYLLADKYCMTALKEYAVSMMLGMSCKDLVDTAKDHLEHMSGLLKEWFACRIGDRVQKGFGRGRRRCEDDRGLAGG